MKPLSRRERDEIRWKEQPVLIGAELDNEKTLRKLERTTRRFLILLHQEALAYIRSVPREL